MSIITPTNADELIEHCLERIGNGMVKVDISKTQAMIRVKEAVTRFVENHYQSTTKAWLKFDITEELMSSKKVRLPDFVVGVDTILSYKMNDYLYRTDAYGTSMWSLLAKNHFGQSTTLSKLDIYLYERELEEWESTFQTMPKFVFNKTTHELTIEGGNFRMNLGSFILLRASITLEQLEGDFWSNSWLARYTSALFLIQWGMNLIKYSEFGIEGGAKIQGEKILAEGKEEEKLLRQELYDEALFEGGVVIG